MEDNVFLLSDASYSSESKIAGLGVVDTFSQKNYKLSINNMLSAYESEFHALALSIKIAIRNGYSNVVFVYDCKYLEIQSLKTYAKQHIKNVQFLWLKRNYLKKSDYLAKSARKLVENLNIKKANKKELIELKNTTLIENLHKRFKKHSTKIKIESIMYIANKREKEILNGFLSSKSINLNVKIKLGTRKATLMKFVYMMLDGDDKVTFLAYLMYVNPNLNKKSFRKKISLQTINNYLMQVINKLHKIKGEKNAK